MTQNNQSAHLPVQKQTVDLQTGAVTTETVNFQIMPARPGTCPDCGTAHDADVPHNAQSMHYQYTFYAREGRWPTWDDALAHCSEEVRAAWTVALRGHGIVVGGDA